MKRHLAIILSILLALLSTASCGKQDENENLDSLVSYSCLENETGIPWRLALGDGHFTYVGVLSQGSSVTATGLITYSGNYVVVPADASPSGQDERYSFKRGSRTG